MLANSFTLRPASIPVYVGLESPVMVVVSIVLNRVRFQTV